MDTPDKLDRDCVPEYIADDSAVVCLLADKLAAAAPSDALGSPSFDDALGGPSDAP